ncbi:his Kinase A domain protein, partial [Vibrio parahaemolyticus V-223/04]
PIPIVKLKSEPSSALMKTRLFSAIQGLGSMTASYTKSLMIFSHSRKAAVAGLAWGTVSV